MKPAGRFRRALFCANFKSIHLFMKFLVGTSGYAYKEWKGSFYPEKLPQKEMLAHYATQFSAVEINYTFRRLPGPSVVESWAQQAPASFRFVLKARQVITHFKRLQNAEKETDDFLRIASILQERQGPILFQLPPNFKKDVARLAAFLGHIQGRAQAAFEFRHPSWFDADVYDCLREHGSALCVADAEDLPATDLVRTANWGYLRLREEGYTDKNLRKWIEKIRSQGWDEVYVFFKHEDAGTGPKLATRFLELAGV
jgi:uncharacterized protein YecE (DUF72 family)